MFKLNQNHIEIVNHDMLILYLAKNFEKPKVLFI